MSSIVVVDGIDVSALRLFLAAVELGSVSKAATRQRISQPSATAKLQKLERQLGTQLLERTPTGSVPTDDGARLTAPCAAVLDAAAALVDRAESLGAERERLAVAATRHVADHFLPTWVATAELPDARLDVVEASTLAVAQAVRAGEATIGFVEGPNPPIGLRSEVVASEAVVPVVGRAHPWFGRRSTVTVDDLRDATVVIGRPGSGTRDVVEAALGGDAVGGDRVEVATSSGARLAALAGTGVAFLPSCRVDDHLASGALFALPLRSVEIDQLVRVVWRGVRPTTRGARRLVDQLAS